MVRRVMRRAWDRRRVCRIRRCIGFMRSRWHLGLSKGLEWGFGLQTAFMAWDLGDLVGRRRSVAAFASFLSLLASALVQSLYLGLIPLDLSLNTHPLHALTVYILNLPLYHLHISSLSCLVVSYKLVGGVDGLTLWLAPLPQGAWRDVPCALSSYASSLCVFAMVRSLTMVNR